MTQNQTGIDYNLNIIDHYKDKKMAISYRYIKHWNFKPKTNRVNFTKPSKVIIGFENAPYFGKI